jgi:hypothetical protein
MYQRIKNHLCPHHHWGANGSQNAGLLDFQPPYVAGNSRDFYCSVTNVKQAQKKPKVACQDHLHLSSDHKMKVWETFLTSTSEITQAQGEWERRFQEEGLILDNVTIMSKYDVGVW